MSIHIIRLLTIALAVSGLMACADDGEPKYVDARHTPMTFTVTHPGRTRATATDFEGGDRISLFVAKADAPLEIGGNLVNNEPLTYDGSNWTASPVSLTFRHIMSKLRIRLVKGEDFDGEMPTTAEVYVHGTVPTATVDLQAGVATRYLRGTSHTIRAHQDGDYTYSAIIVPQRIDNRLPLVEVVMNGVSYMYESRFVFKPGVEHLVNLVISDNPDKVRIDVGGEVEDWK